MCKLGDSIGNTLVTKNVLSFAFIYKKKKKNCSVSSAMLTPYISCVFDTA